MYIHNRDNDWEINGKSFTTAEIEALGITIPGKEFTLHSNGSSVKFNEHGHEVGELKSTKIKTIKAFANKVLVADAKDREQKETTRKANMTYIDKRRDPATGYASVQDQLEMIYKDKVNGTNTFVEHNDEVRTANPKPQA